MTREEAIQILADLIESPFLHTWEKQNKALHMAIEALSAEAVQGEWLYRWNDVECSVCGEFAKDKSNFCPSCGARMKGGAE